MSLGILLQTNQLVIDVRQQIGCFDQEVLQQVFHSLKVTHIALSPGECNERFQCKANASTAGVRPKPKSLMAFLPVKT